MSGAEAPGDDAGVVAVIVTAATAREPLAVFGNGGKRAMLRPVQAARGLSTRNLSGITLYSPAELVISARAGSELPEIEAALAAHGQHLIAEPPDLGPLLGAATPPTLGGTVAANLSGPRRIAAGAMRDHVLGVRAVNGEGTVIHSGGRVLKNVAGLDLCKMLAGSHGTLAVMTEITLKVLPAPESTATLTIPGLDVAQGVAVLAAALGSPFGVSGAAYLPAAAAARMPELGAAGEGVALARLENFAPSVAYRAGRLAAELTRFGPPRLVKDAESRFIWRAIRDAKPLPAAEADAIWRVSIRPSAAPGLVGALAATGAGWFLDWGGGLVWIAAAAEASTHRAITAAASAAGGAWTLLRAPEALRAGLDVLPPPPPALARLTRRVKAAFDPHGILNPGRMYAGI
jgi:glycolate oxidase FAD binding subunit